MADLGIQKINPNKALWEKGDFTRIAETMRESGEDLVATLGVQPGASREQAPPRRAVAIDTSSSAATSPLRPAASVAGPGSARPGQAGRAFSVPSSG